MSLHNFIVYIYAYIYESKREEREREKKTKHTFLVGGYVTWYKDDNIMVVVKNFVF